MSENVVVNEKLRKFSEEDKAKVLLFKFEIDRIASQVITEVKNTFPKEEQWLALGRITNCLVDITYKPAIIENLKSHAKGEL